MDELFIDTSCPDELVRRTESILEELSCEVRSDFDELGRLFFVDVADPDCIGTVEIVLDELEWYSNFCYRESEDDTEEYAVSYVGEFTQDTTPTTEGEENEF